jgi:CheY-like chemotaxis protein
VGHDARAQEHLEGIRQAAESARDLVAQLLTFGRRQVLDLQVVDLRAVVTAFEGILRRVIDEDVCLRISVSDHPVYVRADPGRLEQVLMNLAVNARDAMPDGGVLDIDVRGPSDANAEGEAVAFVPAVLAVRDTGCGMPPETVERVFEPFFTTKGSQGGTGLGLSTVYGIVEQHGGIIRVHSVMGTGTTIEVSLPCIPASAPPVRSRLGSKPLGGEESVLVVDDDPGVRSVVARMLCPLGYAVSVAASAEEAFRLVERDHRHIDLLLADVVMPAPCGGRCVHERIVKSLPGVKVLYMSGHDHAAVIPRGVPSDVREFLQKPFSSADLARKVRAVLDGR